VQQSIWVKFSRVTELGVDIGNGQHAWVFGSCCYLKQACRCFGGVVFLFFLPLWTDGFYSLVSGQWLFSLLETNMHKWMHTFALTFWHSFFFPFSVFDGWGLGTVQWKAVGLGYLNVNIMKLGIHSCEGKYCDFMFYLNPHLAHWNIWF